jgi:uncharacterized protein
MDEFNKTDQNQLRIKPSRGHYDRETIYQIMDEALVCHVGFVIDGQPYVIPTSHARLNDTLYLHGSKASRLLKHIEAGNSVCVEFTLLDGIVFARSAFEHSINYRSVVLFGRGRSLETREEKMLALECLTEQTAKGRWKDIRKPTPKELDITAVIAIDIESASAKVHAAVPNDSPEDYQLPVWAGVLPIQEQALEPVDDGKLLENVAVPEYISAYKRK